jgi:hypothetical protein
MISLEVILKTRKQRRWELGILHCGAHSSYSWLHKVIVVVRLLTDQLTVGNEI